MAIINDQSMIAVPILQPANFSANVFVTSLQPVTGFATVEVFTSPDHAWDEVFNSLNTTTDSFGLFIYQVTTDDFCDKIYSFSQSLSHFEMLVSDRIYDYTDWKAATACYTYLYNNGVTFYRTARDVYTYSHQKFWILDDHTLFISTGNWGSSDYPSGSTEFPPYGDSGWRITNRDYTLKIVNKDIVAQFQQVLDQDLSRGTVWKPDT